MNHCISYLFINDRALVSFLIRKNMIKWWEYEARRLLNLVTNKALDNNTKQRWANKLRFDPMSIPGPRTLAQRGLRSRSLGRWGGGGLSPGWSYVPISNTKRIVTFGSIALDDDKVSHWAFYFTFVELEMDTENVIEMEGQQTILKNFTSHDKIDR